MLPGRRNVNGSTGTAPVFVLVSVGVRVPPDSRGSGSCGSLPAGAPVFELSLGAGAADRGSLGAADAGLSFWPGAAGLSFGPAGGAARPSAGCGAPMDEYDAVLAVGLVRGVVLAVDGPSFGSGAPTEA